MSHSFVLAGPAAETTRIVSFWILAIVAVAAAIGMVLARTGNSLAAELPIGIVKPASAVGATGSLVSCPGKNPPQTCM